MFRRMVLAGALLIPVSFCAADPLDLQMDSAAPTARDRMAGGEMVVRRGYILAQPLTSNRDVIQELIPGVSLNRSSSGGDASDGAYFSVVRDQDAPAGQDKTSYSADFNLTWIPQQTFARNSAVFTNPADIHNGVLQLAAEGHITSVNKSNASQGWNYRLDYSPIVFLFGQNSIDPIVSAKYEADRDYRYQDVVATLNVGLTAPGIGIGNDIKNTHINGFKWRPSIEADLGQVIDKGNSPPANVSQNTTVRLTNLISAQVRLASHDQSDIFGGASLPFVQSVDFFLTNNFYCLPNVGGGRTADYLQLSAAFALSDTNTSKTSVDVSYTIGRSAPSFDKVEKLEAGLSIKF